MQLTEGTSDALLPTKQRLLVFNVVRHVFQDRGTRQLHQSIFTQCIVQSDVLLVELEGDVVDFSQRCLLLRSVLDHRVTQLGFRNRGDLSIHVNLVPIVKQHQLIKHVGQLVDGVIVAFVHGVEVELTGDFLITIHECEFLLDFREHVEVQQSFQNLCSNAHGDAFCKTTLPIWCLIHAPVIKHLGTKRRNNLGTLKPTIEHGRIARDDGSSVRHLEDAGDVLIILGRSHRLPCEHPLQGSQDAGFQQLLVVLNGLVALGISDHFSDVQELPAHIRLNRLLALQHQLTHRGGVSLGIAPSQESLKTLFHCFLDRVSDIQQGLILLGQGPRVVNRQLFTNELVHGIPVGQGIPHHVKWRLYTKEATLLLLGDTER